jgi:hypothetical protein
MEYQVKLIGGVIVIAILVLAALIVGYRLYQNSRNAEEELLKEPPSEAEKSILFLHHSTGRKEQNFPKRSEYGWNNYPYDYWNIWVNHGGNESYMNEPTLEMITKLYDVVVFKHCYPVSHMDVDRGEADVSSDVKSAENYKLQYEALKEKMHQFPDTKFILWTGAALVKENTYEDEAKRASGFFDWVRDEWDEKGDNIYLWDFQTLETEGGLYLKEENARSSSNSHPGDDFSNRVAPFLSNRIIDVIEGRGGEGSLTGE